MEHEGNYRKKVFNHFVGQREDTAKPVCQRGQQILDNGNIQQAQKHKCELNGTPCDHQRHPRKQHEKQLHDHLYVQKQRLQQQHQLQMQYQQTQQQQQQQLQRKYQPLPQQKYHHEQQQAHQQEHHHHHQMQQQPHKPTTPTPQERRYQQHETKHEQHTQPTPASQQQPQQQQHQHKPQQQQQQHQQQEVAPPADHIHHQHERKQLPETVNIVQQHYYPMSKHAHTAPHKPQTNQYEQRQKAYAQQLQEHYKFIRDQELQDQLHKQQMKQQQQKISGDNAVQCAGGDAEHILYTNKEFDLTSSVEPSDTGASPRGVYTRKQMTPSTKRETKDFVRSDKINNLTPSHILNKYGNEKSMHFDNYKHYITDTTDSGRSMRSSRTVISHKSGRDLRKMVLSQIALQNAVDVSMNGLKREKGGGDTTQRSNAEPDTLATPLTQQSKTPKIEKITPSEPPPAATALSAQPIFMHGGSCNRCQGLSVEKTKDGICQLHEAASHYCANMAKRHGGDVRLTDITEATNIEIPMQYAAAAAAAAVSDGSLALTIDDVVSSKVITPMIRKLQRMYLNNLREEMSLMEDLERLPHMVSEVYKSTAFKHK